MNFRNSFVFAAWALLTLNGALSAAQPGLTDIVTGMRSAEAMKADVRHVMELAQEIKTYEELVEPNIDIFLIGVDPELPIRLDILVDPENGQRTLLAVPIAGLNDFINNNLNPIGIIARRDRNDRNFYELTGGVVDGWMRIVKDEHTYAVISTLKAKPIDLPANLPSPLRAIEPFVKAGYGLFAHVKNGPEGIKEREEAFATYRNNLVDAIQKTPQESKEAFELRKAAAAQQLDFLGRIFAETEETTLGSQMDLKEDVLHGKLFFTAISDTNLAKTINQLGERPSYFASLKPAENSVLTLQLDIPIDQQTQLEYKQLYELTRPVAAQHFDEDTKITEEERAARKKIADLFLDVLTTSADLGVINGYVNIAPSGEAHTIVAGVRCTGQDQISQLIDLIPQAKSGWTVKRDVAEEHGVAIHELSLGDKIPAPLKSFYGASGVIYLGIGPEAFWLAGGNESLETLKAAIVQVKENPAAKAEGIMVALNMKALPILDNLHQLSQSGDLDFLKKVRTQQLLPGADTVATPPGSEKKEGDEPLRSNASALKGFKWEEAAIQAMQAEGYDSTVELKIQLAEPGKLTGNASAQNGILRALGAVIAKFADENFR